MTVESPKPASQDENQENQENQVQKIEMLEVLLEGANENFNQKCEELKAVKEVLEKVKEEKADAEAKLAVSREDLDRAFKHIDSLSKQLAEMTKSKEEKNPPGQNLEQASTSGHKQFHYVSS